MNCWIVAIGEPLPIGEGAASRLLRAGLFAEFMAGAGHTVTWWSSAFDHQRRRLVAQQDCTIPLRDGLTLELLFGGGYERNISLARWRDHRRLASSFRRRAAAHAKPDVILVSFPPLELADEVVTWAKRAGVPCVLDLRDMWPDLFLEYVPPVLRGVGRLALSGQFRMAGRTMREATGLCGITEEFLAWGLERAGRPRGPQDAVVPFGYRLPELGAEETIGDRGYWDAQGEREAPGLLRVCFFGTIARQYDFSPLIAAVRQLEKLEPSLRFVICGAGERLALYRDQARGLGNIVFPGWVNQGQILELMRRSAIGLDPMPERADFLATINNKAIEYFCGGLAVVSSPDRGALADLMARRGCGLSVPTGDTDGYVTAFLHMARNPGRVAEMRQNAKRLYDEAFRCEIVHEKMAQHLAQLALAARTGAPRS